MKYSDIMQRRLIRFLKGLLICFTFINIYNASAQESSVYSRFGLGFVNDQNNIVSRSMGSLSASYNSEENLNFINPASYATLELIAFEAGLSGYTKRIKTSTEKEKIGGFDLSYLSFSVPIKEYWTSSFGLMPLFGRSYAFKDTTQIAGTNASASEIEGEGLIYAAYWGNGFKYKDFSVGFNIAYLFGKMTSNTITYALDEDDVVDLFSFTSWKSVELRANGLYWNAGAIYKAPITKKVKAHFGVSGRASADLSRKSGLDNGIYSFNSRELIGRGERENLDDFLGNLSESSLDTVSQALGQETALKLPAQFNIGVTFVSKEFWKAGIDFGWMGWSNFEDFEGNGNQLSNSIKISVGGEYFPIGSKSNQLKSKFFSQLKYRAGVRFEKTPYTVNGEQINEFGINFGFGIPIVKNFQNEEGFIEFKGVHSFNFGFEVGSRGTTSNNLVRENFFRFNLGLSLNDKWFVKRKYY